MAPAAKKAGRLDGNNRAGGLSSYMSIVGWLPRYNRAWLPVDILAGIALAGLLIPEGMGYAGIAGLPPQAGLYAAIAGLFIYALFGSSRQVAVSATSSTAVIVAATVGPMAGADPARYAELTSAIVLLAGTIFLTAWVARLGFVSDFIARPVVIGFVFGLALVIIIRQASKLLGVHVGDGNFFQMSWQAASNLGHTSLPTLAITITGLVILVVLGRYGRKVPAALLLLSGGIAASYLLHLGSHGVALVGAVPSGLPAPALPHISWRDLDALIPGAAGIVLVAYAEGLGSARMLADRHKYEIDPGGELRATGLANICSSLLGGLPVAGGLSGSSANDSNGARSEISSLAAAVFFLLTVLLLTPLFHHLPEAVLGAIVVYAVRHMMNVREIIRFARIRRDSLGMILPALFGVLLFGVLPGLALSVVLSFAIIANELSRPRVVKLGKMKKTGSWVDVNRHPDALTFPGLAIYRIQGALFFASSGVVRNAFRKSVQKAEPRPATVAIDLEALYDIDATSVIMLDDLCQDLIGSGIEVVLTNVHHPVRDILARAGLIDKLGKRRFFSTVDAAAAELAGGAQDSRAERAKQR